MKKSVHINSRIHGASPVSFSSLTYAMDWSFLEEGKKYDVSFTFCSRQKTNVSADMLLYLSVPLTGSAESYTVSDTIAKKNDNVLGLILPYAGSTGYWKSVATENTPITIHSRPSNNLFTVELRDYQGTLYNIETHYMLTLSFEEI